VSVLPVTSTPIVGTHDAAAVVDVVASAVAADGVLGTILVKGATTAVEVVVAPVELVDFKPG
jgi:hypothetical protein